MKNVYASDLHNALDELFEGGIYVNRDVFSLKSDVALEPPLELPGGLREYQGVNIGAFSYSWSTLVSSINSIGRYCSIAGEVRFAELEHPTSWISTSSFTYERNWMWGRFAKSQHKNLNSFKIPYFDHSPGITIGNDVWIGMGAYIRGGVSLGDGCIIAARAVVTKDVPPYAVVAGNPGRIVKFRFDDKIISRLLQLSWWDYDFTNFPLDKVHEVEKFIDFIEGLVSNKTIPRYMPEKYIIINK